MYSLFKFLSFGVTAWGFNHVVRIVSLLFLAEEYLIVGVTSFCSAVCLYSRLLAVTAAPPLFSLGPAAVRPLPPLLHGTQPAKGTDDWGGGTSLFVWDNPDLLLLSCHNHS